MAEVAAAAWEGARQEDAWETGLPLSIELSRHRIACARAVLAGDPVPNDPCDLENAPSPSRRKRVASVQVQAAILLTHCNRLRYC